MTKQCGKCGDVLPVSGFYLSRGVPESPCKECRKGGARRRYQTDARARDAAKAQATRWRRANPGRKRTNNRRWLAANRDKANASSMTWYHEHPQQAKATRAVNNAIRDGRLRRRPCSECGAPQGDAHHEDYSKPFDIVWLCHPCHMRHHRRIPDEEVIWFAAAAKEQAE